MDFINALAWLFAAVSLAMTGLVFYQISNTSAYVMDMPGVFEKAGKRILQYLLVFIVSILWLIFG